MCIYNMVESNQEWTKKNLWKTISLLIFKRLSSTNFTWYIVEYFVPYIYCIALIYMWRCYIVSDYSCNSLRFRWKVRFPPKKQLKMEGKKILK